MNHEEFQIKNENDWKNIHYDIFGDRIPRHQEWAKLPDIISILNKVGKVKASNHLFFPDGGGLDLEGASKSYEKGAIELQIGISHIIRPKKLIFENISDDLNWNYFRLEADDLAPSNVYEEYPHGCYNEELTELSPLDYVDSSYWDENSYHGKALLKTSRIIIRYFKGSFVIFKKTSPYNKNKATYDGRHEKLGREGFKNHVQAACEYFK